MKSLLFIEIILKLLIRRVSPYASEKKIHERRPLTVADIPQDEDRPREFMREMAVSQDFCVSGIKFLFCRRRC
jgi:hypothetical protein